MNRSGSKKAKQNLKHYFKDDSHQDQIRRWKDKLNKWEEEMEEEETWKYVEPTMDYALY